MKKAILITGVLFIVFGMVSAGICAYHHEGETDSDKFLSVYPDKQGTKLDHCALCHSGGQYESKGEMVPLGSCQWCHYTYGYDASGNISDTLNPYGQTYYDHGRSTNAIKAIEGDDSDGDTLDNLIEIQANRFPGNDQDDPDKVPAPYRVYTRAQLEGMAQHTQFLLMNTSRSGDFYAEYTGVPMEQLLQDAGILPGATGILVYAPDGWSQYHPLDEDPDSELYHVNGTYPSSVFYYDPEADVALNPVDGWCDYSAPSCSGRGHLDTIAVPDGLKMILAYKREGGYMDPGILNPDNKLDGEGPFRVVPPQKTPGPPDQSSRADNQAVVWPYVYEADHNAGAASRTATIIKVDPLPAGTTDIDILEAGWAYVDQAKIVIYGALDGADSNGNGILDSEEGTNDCDNDGTPDYQDTNTACLRHSKGADMMSLQASKGAFQEVEALNEDDPAIPQLNRPAAVSLPYGTVKFKLNNLPPGDTATVKLVFPGPIPTNYKYYKIDSINGWHEIQFGSNDGDNEITLTLTDGDPATDADGLVNGVIVDPGAVAATATPATTAAGGGGGGGCFISTLQNRF
jgi:hypothetical protein